MRGDVAHLLRSIVVIIDRPLTTRSLGTALGVDAITPTLPKALILLAIDLQVHVDRIHFLAALCDL